MTAVVPQFEPLTQRPDLVPQIGALLRAHWPAFVLEGCSREGMDFWSSLDTRWPAYQLTVVCASAPTRLVALINSVPLRWRGDLLDLPRGWDDALARGLALKSSAPDTLSAAAITIAASARGQGLSSRCLGALKARAREMGIARMIAPVRPNHKSRYPLVEMRDYLRWRRDDGQLRDPWLRTHERIGGRVLGVARRSMHIRGSCAQWERWCQMSMPETGRYVASGCLGIIHIDRQRDLGWHDEANVWVEHPLAT